MKNGAPNVSPVAPGRSPPSESVSLPAFCYPSPKMHWHQVVILENTVREWIVGFGLALAAVVVVFLLRELLRRRLGKIATLTATPFDDFLLEIVLRTKTVLFIFPAFFFGDRTLTLHPKVQATVDVLGILSLLIQAGIWGNGAVDFWLRRYEVKKLDEDAAAATSLAAVRFVSKAAIWSVVALLVLDNLGFNVRTLVAGLGVGGIAIALATQKILGDLFASLSIVLDKPFVIGDSIMIGTEVGTVEYVGLKTTRMRSVNGEEISVSNSDLLNSRIRNFKRMNRRRVSLTFGVVYQTPREKLERIPEMIKSIVTAVPGTRFDRAHFKAFGASSLDFEAVYFVEKPDLPAMMDVQQTVNLELISRFAAEGIEFAFPAPTLIVARSEA